MEVHTHSHTVRKKWTHYLWEFLMLFLAVFCGFLAENQREHIVEKKRAKQYAVFLYGDLLDNVTAMEERSEFMGTCVKKFHKVKLIPIVIVVDSTFKIEQPSLTKSLRLYKQDTAWFEQYANLCALKQLDYMNRINLQKRALKSGLKLIENLKKEYHLK